MRPSFTASALLALALSASFADAATLVLQQGNLPSASYAGTLDAFVTSGTTNNADPGRNYGAAGALAVSAPPSTAPANTQGEFQSLIEFDLAIIKSSFDSQFGAGAWNVSAVGLQVTAQPPTNAIFNGSSTSSNAAGNIDIRWMANDTWLEGTGTPGSVQTTGITYNNLSSFTSGGDQALGTFNFAGGTSGNSTFNLGLSSGLLGDISSGSTVSFRLLASPGSQVSALFNSRSYTGTGFPGTRPALIISANAVPEPGRILLMTIGMLLTVFRRTRIR